MEVGARSFVGCGLLVVGLAAAGCGRSSPVSPTVSSTLATQSASAATANRPAVQAAMRPKGATTFPLNSGSFQILNTSGDSISGTYTGTARFAPGLPEKATLTLQITGGTGVYAGISGTATGTGVGAFAGEGTFSIDVRGDAALPSGKHAQITLNLSGSAAASCSASNQIAITLTGAGTMGRAGRVRATFSHLVGNADCIS